MTDLAEYLMDRLQELNLSMRQASLECGLSADTIGVIVRQGNDRKPRPDTLRAISRGLDLDFHYMMVLAGHLEPGAEDRDLEVERYARQFEAICRNLRKVDPERARGVMQAAIDMMHFLSAAAEKVAEPVQGEEEKENFLIP